jgi:transcriptional regulator with XRE-family HTH domain
LDPGSDGRCEGCGRELIQLDNGPSEAPALCEDCRPETGRGSRLLAQFAINLRRHRLAAGIEREQLASRSKMALSQVAEFEGDDPAHEPELISVLRLADALGTSLEDLTERIYWNPGQMLYGLKRKPPERLTGFFQILPGNVADFGPSDQPTSVANRREAAAIFGAAVRSARERRHLTQVELGRAAGLSKSGLSLIERGITETTTEKLLAIARALEVPPGFLLGGLAWMSPSDERPAAAVGGARRRAGSLDEAIIRLWNEDKTSEEIAEAVGASEGTVSAAVHRLRERGECVPYRRPPTTAAQKRARHRRETCTAVEATSQEDAQAVCARPLEPASRDEVGVQIGANVAAYRERAGLTLRQLAEAAETHQQALRGIENWGVIPRLGFALKLAASLNVRCGLLTAGLRWDSASRSFYLEDVSPEPPPRVRLGLNAFRLRHRLGLSQQALADRASIDRGDVVDFESGTRNFRLFTVIRLAAALEIDFAELFLHVASWNLRPLPAPEFCPGERPSKADRDRQLVRLWNEARSEEEIANALGLSKAAVGPYVRELRDAGEHLPYRRPPRRAVEAAARLRRRGEHPRKPPQPSARRRSHEPPHKPATAEETRR